MGRTSALFKGAQRLCPVAAAIQGTSSRMAAVGGRLAGQGPQYVEVRPPPLRKRADYPGGPGREWP